MNWLKPLCPVCGSPTERGFRPCRSCGADMEQRRTEACSLCGAELAGGADPCRACRERNSPGLVERVVALGYWRGPLREWLSIYKYGGDSRMAVFLIEGLASVIRNEWPERTVVPVPPRHRRVFREGFDPVGFLSAGLQKSGIRVEALLRRKGDRTQKSLDRQQRLSSGALNYTLKRPTNLNGRDFVLLDDVCTTGATLEACAAVLHDAGARITAGVVVCRD